jgi:hypothetical protein
VVFVFASIKVLYYIYRFAYVEPPLHPWDKADLVIVNGLSDTSLDSVNQTKTHPKKRTIGQSP